MKKTLSFLALTLLLSMVGTFSAFAASIVGQEMGKDGVTYKVIKLKVYNKTEVREAEVSIVSTGTPKTLSDDPVNVPGEVVLNVGGEDGNGNAVSQQDITFKVTVIEKVGYGNLNGVKTFNIPASIREIKEGAFHNAAMQGNADLQINFAANSELETIGDYAFGNCAIKTLNLSNCNKLNLSTGTPFLSAGSNENNYLGEVILPTGIKEIGTAFAGIPSLEKLDLSKTSVTVLEEGALVGTGIKEVILPKVTNPTVQTVRIEDNAFGTPEKPSKVETLIIQAPIAADGAIWPDAFKEMPALKTVKFQGDITLPNAILANAFTYTDNGAQKPSPIETLTFAGLGAKAISDNAFSGVSTLKSLVFTGTIAGGAIGKQAFAGIGTTAAACPAITFKQPLLGENAIGEQAFLGAAAGSIKFTEDATIAAKAIASEAFKDLNTTKDCYASLRFESQLGERAIGQNAFENAHLQYVLFSKPINQIGAIRNYAFLNATILGSATADWAIQFLGDLTAQYSIGKGAFQGADIRKAIWFSGNVAGDGAKTPVITIDAFKDFKSTGVAGVPVLFKGDVTGNGVIDQQAFLRGSISTLTITGVIAGQNAIEEFAFAGLSNVGEINLGSRIYGDNEYSAIQSFAFAGSGKATTVLNIGDLKSTNAIEAGAFVGATFDIVNFSRLMAEEAIAANQFGGILASRMMEPTDGIEGLNTSAAASINTVNFNQEFKAWPEAWNNASKNFIGSNAFSNTGVSQVNFNEPVSVADAIVAYDAEYSPFAENGKEMKVDFKKGVVAGGIGAYAFANSNVIEITLAEDAIYEEEAFAAHSFYGISWEKGKTPNAVVKYAPKSNSLADRAFAKTAFYDETSVIDVQFKTTKYVLDLYTEENQTSDLTPWRVKFIASKFIDLVWSEKDKCYVGVFTPENEMYAIDKYQEEFEKKPWDSRKEVGVWSAYVDGRTLEVAVEMDANGVPTEPITPLVFNNWKTKNQFVADTYINPLRVQDHFYFLNPGHTLIITANYPGPVEATQYLGDDVFGGVQTFGDYNAWQCNDLRWNPAESKEWGGYVNFVAIMNHDKDWYGNVIADYELFRQLPFADGIDFANSINLPDAQLYMLVTKDLAKRKLYSSYYDEDGEPKAWFTGHDIPWEKSVTERIAELTDQAAADAQNAYAQGKADGKEEAEKAILDGLNEMLGEGNEKGNIDDAIDALIDQAAEEVLAKNSENIDKIKEAATALKEAIQNYVYASLAMAYDQGVMDKANYDGNEYYLVEKKNPYTDEWDLVTEDTDDYEGDIYNLSELPDGYRQVFPMGFPSIEDGYAQDWDSDAPFMPNTYDLGDGEQYEGITLFGKSYDGYTISSYEEWLKTLIAEKTGELEDDPEGDNIYDAYKERSNSDYDLESDPGFQQALQVLGVPTDILNVLVDPVSAVLKEAAEKWQAVKAIYTSEDFSDDAKDYIAATVDERRAIWNDPTTSEELKQELRDFCAALRAADPTQDSGYGFVYDDAKIAEQDAAISDYEEAVANYNAAVATAAREVGLERFAFMLYTAAVMANEPQQDAISALDELISDNDIEELKAALEEWFDNSVAYLENEGRDETYPNYITAYNNRKASYAIDKLNKYLEHLQNSWVYEAFDDVRDEIGAPVDAVMADDGETELIAAQPAVAGGLYDQLFNEETGLKAKKDAAVLALINAVNGIDVPAPARMNIIWNDRPANEVVGIMEAVVNGAVTKDGDNIIYNLNGMRVKTASKGIFIQNGKKVIK